MNEYLVTFSVFMMLASLISALIVFCFVSYHLYLYWLENNVVKGYWDFIAYIYGQQINKKYKIIFDKTVNQHPSLHKAKILLFIYWGLMVTTLLMLFSVLWFSE